jgi:hypothetical protein
MPGTGSPTCVKGCFLRIGTGAFVLSEPRGTGSLKRTRSLFLTKKTGLPVANPVFDFWIQGEVVGVKVETDPGVLSPPSSVGSGVTRLTRTTRICPG